MGTQNFSENGDTWNQELSLMITKTKLQVFMGAVCCCGIPVIEDLLWLLWLVVCLWEYSIALTISVGISTSLSVRSSS